MQFQYAYNGEQYTVKLEWQPDGSLLAQIGEAQYRVRSGALLGGTVLLVNGERTLAYIASSGERRYVQVNGTQYQLEKVEAGRRRGSSAAGSGDLSAEMPGQVIDVRVAEGDRVEAGAVLVVLEAMKMEIRLTAPTEGTIVQLFANVGDVVERGQVLVELQHEADS